MRRRIRIATLALPVVLALAACGDDDATPATGTDPAATTVPDRTTAPGADSTTGSTTVPPATTTEGSTTVPDRTLPPDRQPEPVPSTTELPPVTGQVPAGLLAEIVADAAERTGLTTGDVEVVRDQAVTWPDGSLGCPQPGMEYTQALVPGYWVVLEAGDQQLDYRVGRQGSFRLCENPGAAPPPMVDPSA